MPTTGYLNLALWLVSIWIPGTTILILCLILSSLPLLAIYSWFHIHQHPQAFSTWWPFFTTIIRSYYQIWVIVSFSDSNDNVLSIPTASAENTLSPSPRSSSSSSSSEGLQHPRAVLCKNISPESEVSNSMLQASCQQSSPSIQTKECRYIYCDPWGLPKKSKMVTEDYCTSGTGTGDSGVGDVHHHTLSYKALQRKLDHLPCS